MRTEWSRRHTRSAASVRRASGQTDGERWRVTPLDVSGLPLMHPVTRMGRVIQQLRSFGELHGGELDGFADELEASGATEFARRLRVLSEMQRDEGQMAVDALVDLQGDLAAETQSSQVAAAPVAAAGGHATAADGPAPGDARTLSAPGGSSPPADEGQTESGAPFDPAVNSPRRAKWLAEQAAEAERLRQPFSRRDLFGRGTPRSDS